MFWSRTFRLAEIRMRKRGAVQPPITAELAMQINNGMFQSAPGITRAILAQQLWSTAKPVGLTEQAASLSDPENSHWLFRIRRTIGTMPATRSQRHTPPNRMLN
jgi:hypothetical protein